MLPFFQLALATLVQAVTVRSLLTLKTEAYNGWEGILEASAELWRVWQDGLEQLPALRPLLVSLGDSEARRLSRQLQGEMVQGFMHAMANEMLSWVGASGEGPDATKLGLRDGLKAAKAVSDAAARSELPGKQQRAAEGAAREAGVAGNDDGGGIWHWPPRSRCADCNSQPRCGASTACRRAAGSSSAFPASLPQLQQGPEEDEGRRVRAVPQLLL
jgi:hypothetical protein